MNTLKITRLPFFMGVLLLSVSFLSACVESSGPILKNARAEFGPTFRMQLFSLRKGLAREPEQATYVWNGAHYVHAAGGMSDIKAFTVHPFEGIGYIAQSVPSGRESTTDYALMRTLTEGVYLLTPVDEDDADEATRAANCRKTEKSSCRIETEAQLIALAHATAAQRKDSGGLVIRLADGD